MKEIIERDEEKNTCLVARCENCGRLHVYKRERKDGEGCLCCGGGPMRMLGNAIVHENKTSDVKVRVSVEREELDKLIKDMDRVKTNENNRTKNRNARRRKGARRGWNNS